MSSKVPTAHVWDLVGHDGPVVNAKFNKDGRYCMTCGGKDRTLRLWNPSRLGPDGRGALLVKTYTGPHGYEIKDVVVAHDNSRFASCGKERIVFVWDVTSGNVLRKFFGHDLSVNAVALNEEATVLASGSDDKTVRLWDMKSFNREPIQILPDARDGVTSVVIREHEILTGSADGSLRLYDLRAGLLRRVDFGEPVASLALSNDGKCALAACLDDTLRLVESGTGDVLNKYRGHRNRGVRTGCSFSRDDALVVCGSEDGRVVFWDLVEAKPVRTIEHHTRPISAVAVHPSSDIMLSASYDGSCAVWATTSLAAQLKEAAEMEYA